MKRAWLIVLLIGMSLLFAAQARASDTFVLKGVEIAKGVDVDLVRYGTSFVGEVYDQKASTTIGYWNITLNYIGADQVGVCGGTNDVVWFRINMYFTKGKLRGNKLVLGLTDNSQANVDWSLYDTPCTQIGGFDCDCPSGSQTSCTGYPLSNLAEISISSLSPQLGTTLKNVSSASLDGYLCHTYPVVPRVSGTLTVEY